MDDLQTAFDRGFEAVKTYVDAELGLVAARLAELKALPPELAEQVASAARLLHEPPPVIPPQPVLRIARVERDRDGSFVPVYEA